MKLLGVSCEGIEDLEGWAKDIEVYAGLSGHFPITLVSDEDRSVAFKYVKLSLYV